MIEAVRQYDTVIDGDGNRQGVFHVKQGRDNERDGCPCACHAAPAKIPSVWNWICAAAAAPLVLAVLMLISSLIIGVVQSR